MRGSSEGPLQEAQGPGSRALPRAQGMLQQEQSPPQWPPPGLLSGVPNILGTVFCEPQVLCISVWASGTPDWPTEASSVTGEPLWATMTE